MTEDLYATSSRRKRVYTQLRWSKSTYAQLKYTLRYTLVCVDRSAYIRYISKGKARMQTRVWWSKGYEISDLFCCVSAIWSMLISICWWCMFVLKSMERVQSENMMKHGLQMLFYWSCWIQCENWWNVVQGGAEGCSLQSGGSSSLPGEAGKRAQVVACVLVKSAPAHML